jgi:hypothetical protein
LLNDLPDAAYDNLFIVTNNSGTIYVEGRRSVWEEDAGSGK